MEVCDDIDEHAVAEGDVLAERLELGTPLDDGESDELGVGEEEVEVLTEAVGLRLVDEDLLGAVEAEGDLLADDNKLELSVAEEQTESEGDTL